MGVTIGERLATFKGAGYNNRLVVREIVDRWFAPARRWFKLAA